MEAVNYILDKQYIRYGILFFIIFLISVSNNIENEINQIFHNKIIKLIFLILILISGKYDNIIMLLLASLYLIIASINMYETSESFITGKPDGIYKIKNISEEK